MEILYRHMVFSDTTTKLGLIQDCEMQVFGNYGDISGNTDRLYEFTARLDRSYDKLATRIMAVDNRWQFDDTNYTDLPIGSTDIVSGQQDYAFDVEYLDIDRVVLTDSAGNKSVLYPIDIMDAEGRAYITALTASNTGIPNKYDKMGGSIFLDPIPNFNRTGGLTVYYRRKPSYFAYTDTTKPVGVPAVFHRYLSLDTSLGYMLDKQMAVKNDKKTELVEMEAMIDNFYTMRNKDEVRIIRGTRISSR